jgi:hypothetical protein
MLSRSETELSLQPIWFGNITQGRRSTAGGFAVCDGSLDASALYQRDSCKKFGQHRAHFKQTEFVGTTLISSSLENTGHRVEGSHMEVMAGVVLAATAVGFVLGYGVREAISQHRRTEARRRRHI